MIKFPNYAVRALFSPWTITVNSRNKLGTVQLIKQHVTRNRSTLRRASGRGRPSREIAFAT